MDYKKKYEEWLNADYFDTATKKELSGIADNEKEIEDRFYKDLYFGTAGLRGIIGAGTNRMNKYTVCKATKGLANYILKKGVKNPSVVIAHDSRHFSREFSEQAAALLCAHDIDVYIFPNLRSTPELSFAVRQTKSTAGIVVTASHNPPEYNGFKVYWDYGAQVSSPIAEELMSEINSISDMSVLRLYMEKDLKEFTNLHILGEEMDKKYIDSVLSLSVNPQSIKDAKDIKIVYTPLHGAGNIPVRRALKEAGFEKVNVVPAQELPDGSFPTVKYPNPEEADSFLLALDLAKKIDADLIIATDPDCDRLGVMVKLGKGEYIRLTGNQVGIILTHYIFDSLKNNGNLKENSLFVDTIVTGKMAEKIAKSIGVNTATTLTGFKHIASVIKDREAKGQHFVFAFEESYGYLAGGFVRDKDGVSASLLICEAAAFYKSKNMSIYDGLLSLYDKYGYYKEDLFSIVLKGKEGAETILRMMDCLRKNPPKSLAGLSITEFRDYLVYESPDGVPKDNVLYVTFEDNSWFAIRPSGTEPKIKIYLAVKGNSRDEADEKMDVFRASVKDLIEGITAS
ncbi:MAG: phospho-sugar mutase [Clostridiales bacterium]|nr:phospho-sugar mutase [Clostridiales bacterium]